MEVHLSIAEEVGITTKQIIREKYSMVIFHQEHL